MINDIFLHIFRVRCDFCTQETPEKTSTQGFFVQYLAMNRCMVTTKDTIAPRSFDLIQRLITGIV